MKQERPMVVLAAVIVQIALLFAPAQGRESYDNGSANLQGGIVNSLESSEQNKVIQRALLADVDHKNLQAQSDYRRYSGESYRDLDRVIRQAYNDILRREPDEQGLRYYRSRMTDYGWTELDVRSDLERRGAYSQPGSQISRREAERIVRRAYLEILGREPDPGAQGWVDKILHDRWTEQDVVQALRDSDEYRRGGYMTRRQAEQMVRRAYLDVLGREPDAGAEGWVDKVLRDRWTEQDVVRALRDSDEYRRRRR